MADLGDVKLSVDLQADKVTKKARQLSKEISKDLSMVDTKKASAGFQTLTYDIQKTRQQSINLRREIYKLQENPIKSRSLVETDEFKAQTKNVQEFQRKLAEAKDSFERFKISRKIGTDDINNALRKYESGSKERLTQQDIKIFTDLNKIAELRSGLQAAKDELQLMKDNGEQFKEVIVTTEKDIEALSTKLASVNDRMAKQQIKLQGKPEYRNAVEQLNTDTQIKREGQEAVRTTESLRQLDSQKKKTTKSNAELGMEAFKTKVQLVDERTAGIKLSDAFKTLTNAVRKAFTVMGAIGNGAKSLINRLRGINTGTQDTTKSMKSLFKFALKYGLGLRSIFILYKRLRSAGVEAYKGLASQFPELQAELNDLKNSFFQLKNSLATMAQPILSYLVPAIKTLMSWLSAAMTAIANFFAILTGAKYIYKATNANKDWAKSASGAGKAAKEANEDIAEYDNLILIQQDKDGSGGGGGGVADDYAGAFEKVKAESDLAKEIKDAVNRGDWEGVGTALAKRLNSVTEKLDTWINTEFRPTAKKWATNIARILNGLTDTWNSELTGKTLADGLMAIYDTIATFYEKYNFKNLGKKVGTAITSFFTNWEPQTVARKIAGKFNAVINFLGGLLENLDFNVIGSRLGETLRRTLENINWKQLGADLSGLATGILEGLSTFIRESNAGVTVGNAINDFLSKIDFAKLTRDISDLAINILNALADALETVDWVAVGQAIADILKNIDWGKFLSTLLRVAVALIKGLGTALLQIATDPEALGSLATGLLAIFGTKWIWGKITGLFSKNIASSLTSGLASSGGGNIVGNWLSNIFTSGLGQTGSLGGNIAQGLIAGTVTYAGVGSIAGNINSVLADAIFNDEALTKEYQKFAKNAIGYTKDTIIEVKNAINEESTLTGDSIFTNAIKDMASGYDYLETKTQEFHNQQQAIRDEEFEKYLDMIQRRAEAGKEINATDIALLKEYRGIVVATTETARKQTEALEAEAYRQEAIEKHKAGVISDAELATIASMTDAAIVSRKTMEDTAKHYADIEKSKIQASEESIKKMKEAQQAQKEAAEESRKTLEATASHYAEIEKSKVEDAQKSAERMKAYMEEMAKIQRESAQQTADSMAASYESGTQKAQTAFSGMSGEYENMTQQICASVATIPGEFERDFNTAYDKATTAFSNTNSFFGKVAEGVKSPFGTMASYFKDTFTTSWNGVVDVFQSNSPQFQSIQDSVSGVFKSSINSMIGGINSSFVTPFQTLSSAFSKLRGFSINGTNPFSSLPFFNIPKIPKLAQGAVLPPNSPFLAVVGDQRQGTNIETPLDTMVDAFKQALAEYGGNNQPIVLTINGRQVAQAVWDEENKRYKQTGMRYKYS